MACIFATYSRKISTILSLFHLHFLLFWGLVTGSLTSLPMNSGNCPIRTTSLKFHESMTSVGKTVSDFTLSASSVFNFPSFVTSSSSPSSSSSSALLSLPLHSSSKKLYKKKNMNNLDKILQDDPFMNRLSFTHHHHPPTSTNTLSECSKQSKKRKDIMNDLINSNNFGNSEIVVIGLSHHTAPVDVREKLSIPETEWNHASTELCQYDSINEAAVLSTCNRFEMYLVGRNQYEAMTDALNYLLKRTNGTLNEEILRQSIFMLSGEDAIWHLMRVTAGLEPPFSSSSSSSPILCLISFIRLRFDCHW